MSSSFCGIRGPRRGCSSARAAFALVVWFTGCASSPGAPIETGARVQTSYMTPYADESTLDPKIPNPESVIEHAVGDAAVRYDALVRYLQALDVASPLVSMTPHGTTHEGRTLYHVTITSEANFKKLDQIKADNARLADPRTLSDPAEVERIVDSLPGIAWMAYSIHGDELSGCDAAVQVAYQLAAGTDETTRRLRDELVIHIDPLQNPDGRERYLSQLQHLTGKVPNTDYQAMQHGGLWSAGRGNHYLFDLNRDWLMQVHPETQGRVAAILEWHPHLLVDGHEMGSLDTYLFDPPREPINGNLSENNLKWRRLFSGAQAEAFDKHGWSYYTQEWYEEWYPGYTNALANLFGAVGILYEQAGVNAAAVKQASGQVLTYREAVHHQLVSTLANLETLRANRKAVLRDFFDDRKWSAAPHATEQEVFLLPPHEDHGRVTRFSDLLARTGIEFGFATTPFAAENVRSLWGERSERVELPAGTMIVRAAQPNRRWLTAILEFDPRTSDAFLIEERKSLENHRGTRIYDVTGWNVAMSLGLPAYWAADVPDVPTQRRRDASSASIPDAKATYGYLIDARDSALYPMLGRLLEQDAKVRIARKPFRAKGRDYRPGAVLVRNHENAPGILASLLPIAKELNLEVVALDTALSQSGPDLGGNEFDLLSVPRVAIASQWPIDTTSFGAVWHLLDARVGLRASPVNVHYLGGVDLRTYNVLVLPDCWGASTLAGVLPDGIRTQLREWVESGGTLIALGSAAAFVADKDVNLSAVRNKQDVLDKLDVYTESLQRESSARAVSVDPSRVWAAPLPTPVGAPSHGAAKGDGAAESSGTKQVPPAPTPEPTGKPGDVEKLKRDDAWQRLFSPHGVFVAAALDPEHWLTFGLDDKLSVLIDGSNAFMASFPVGVPARLVSEEQLRLSGLMWPEARQRWANTAYATVERRGRGQIILFASDPAFRGYLDGSTRLLLNAILFGPGMGASQPVPW